MMEKNQRKQLKERLGKRSKEELENRLAKMQERKTIIEEVLKSKK